MDSRFDARNQSVRKLPKGLVQKYRQMYDQLAANKYKTQEFLQLPRTDDEKFKFLNNKTISTNKPAASAGLDTLTEDETPQNETIETSEIKTEVKPRPIKMAQFKTNSLDSKNKRYSLNFENSNCYSKPNADDFISDKPFHHSALTISELENWKIDEDVEEEPVYKTLEPEPLRKDNFYEQPPFKYGLTRAKIEIVNKEPDGNKNLQLIDKNAQNDKDNCTFEKPDIKNIASHYEKRLLENEKTNLVKTKFLSKSCQLNSSTINQSVIESEVERPKQSLFNNQQSSFTYVTITDDPELSDDSFDDDNDEPTGSRNNFKTTVQDKVLRQNQGFNESSISNIDPDQEVYDKVKEFKLDLNKAFNIDTPSEFRIESPKSPEHIYETVTSIQQFIDKNNKPHSPEKSNKNADKNHKKTFILTSKMAVSEPNLSTLGTKKKTEMSNAFTRAFYKLKKTFSRKSINESENSETESVNANMNAANNNEERFRKDSFTSSNETSNSGSEEELRDRLNSDIIEIHNSLKKRVENNRKIYEKLSSKAPVYTDSKESFMKSLFSYVVIVGLEGRDPNCKPKVMWQFPDMAIVEANIPDFCFPDPNHRRSEHKKHGSEIFQFTLTDMYGSRSYGFCLKIISKSSQPLVFCILSPIDAIEMYNAILDETKKLHVTDSIELDDCKAFLSALYSKPLPNRGDTLAVYFGTKDIKCIELKRNHDRRLERDYLHTLLDLNTELIIKIYASMLNERKIIFLSNKLSVLSNTIQTLEILLYPFSWPHTFVPVLPSYLIEMCEAPTPYMIGVMRHQKSEVMSKDISDVLVVDLDNQKCIQEDGNELKILPLQIVNWIKADIENILLTPKDQTKKRNELLCDTFMNLFVRTVGHYKKHLIYNENDERRSLNYETFIDAAQSSHTKEFLEWFTKTQVFEVFILNKTNPKVAYGISFDAAVAKYSQTNSADRHSNENSPKTVKQIKVKDKQRKSRF